MGKPESKLLASHVTIQEQPETDSNYQDTFTGRIRHNATHIPEREAVVFVSTDGTRESVTFKELFEKSQKVAMAFITMGLKRNEIVAINLRPCPDWLYLTFGAMFAGVVPISMAFTYTDGSDVIAMMKKLETCAMIVVDPGANQEIWTILNKLVQEYSAYGNVKSHQMPYLRYLVCHTRPVDTTELCTLEDMLKSHSQECVLPKIDPNDIAVLFQTSGSTGVPKVVVHTHKSMLFARKIFEYDAYSPDDIYLNDRPFSWIGGFPFGIIAGQTRVTMSGFCEQPKDKLAFTVDVSQRENCSVILLLPPFIPRLPQIKKENPDFHVKSIITGGMPVSKALSECVKNCCDYFVVIYAGTEMISGTWNVVKGQDKFIEYACGTPMRGMEVKVVDDHETTVPVNDRGEILIRHEGLFKCYYNDDAKTKPVKTNDGWFKTDDLGRMNEDGVLYVEGRKSNVIISGTYNVAPEILETVMKTCPGVENVAIVPVADETMYQVICACVIFKKGSDVTVDSVREFCEEFHNDKPRLFTVLPKFYLTLDTFPELSTGKISRKELTEQAERSFGKVCQ